MNENIRCPLFENPIDRPSEYTCACALSGLITDQLDDLFREQQNAAAEKLSCEAQLEYESHLPEEEIQRLRNDDTDYEKLWGHTPGETSVFEYEMSLYGIAHLREKIQIICRGKHPDAKGQLYLFDRFSQNT